MTVAKVIEVISEGDTIEEAMKLGLAKTSKTLHNIKQMDVKHLQAIVSKDQKVKFRVNAKVTFVVED